MSGACGGKMTGEGRSRFFRPPERSPGTAFQIGGRRRRLLAPIVHILTYTLYLFTAVIARESPNWGREKGRRSKQIVNFVGRDFTFTEIYRKMTSLFS